MIYTNMSQIERYLGLSAPLDTAIRYLKEADLTKLVMGRNEVDGDNVFINRFDYDTLPQDAAAWEGHLQYADLHVVLSGQEQMGVGPLEEMTEEVEARPEGDIWFYHGPLSTILLSGRRFTALWPGDAHAPGIAVDRKPAPCRKCVVKVRADWEG